MALPDFTEEERAEVIRAIRAAIDGDRYVLSPRVKRLKSALAKLAPASAERTAVGAIRRVQKRRWPERTQEKSSHRPSFRCHRERVGALAEVPNSRPPQPRTHLSLRARVRHEG
jgi:hypothetical protein